jgi:hypothetical protein
VSGPPGRLAVSSWIYSALMSSSIAIRAPLRASTFIFTCTRMRLENEEIVNATMKRS